MTTTCPFSDPNPGRRNQRRPESRSLHQKAAFNRTEHLRQIAPDTSAGKRLKGFRQDSESQHSTFDQAYPHERVPAYGAVGALLIYLGFAWVNNSIARTFGARKG